MALHSDIERVLLNEVEISSLVSNVAEQITKDLSSSSHPVTIVGVATGAFMFLADIVRKIEVPFSVDLIRVESYGSGTESNGKPRISSDLKIDVRGKHVILVEDIVDTGNTLAILISHLESKGACSISVCTFLDKPSRRKIRVRLLGDGKFYRGFEVLLIQLSDSSLLLLLFRDFVSSILRFYAVQR